MIVVFNNKRLHTRIGKYANGANTCLQLETGDGAPYCTASVNIERKLEPGFIAIKSWSENAGVDVALIKAGVIGEAVGFATCGYATATVHKLLV